MPATAGGAPNKPQCAPPRAHCKTAARLIADHSMILANPRGYSASSSTSSGSGSFKPEDAGATPVEAATFRMSLGTSEEQDASRRSAGPSWSRISSVPPAPRGRSQTSRGACLSSRR